MRARLVGPWLAALAAVIGMLMFAISVGYTLHQQDIVNHRLCETSANNREAIRTTWEAARRLLLEAQETEEERKGINDLFDGILESIPPLHCVDSNPAPVGD